MASSRDARLLLIRLLVVVLLLLPGHAAAARSAPAVAPAIAARQEFHVAATTGRPDGGGMAKNGGAARRPVRRGTGAWAFSAMLPRGFVPPSGSSACHNDMPATAANTQFFVCANAGNP